MKRLIDFYVGWKFRDVSIPIMIWIPTPPGQVISSVEEYDPSADNKDDEPPSRLKTF